MRTARLGIALCALVAVLVIGAPFQAPRAAADDLEARALKIERTLLCQHCTNLRLHVCETQLCIDMRPLIRQKLAAGESDDDVQRYFTDRYGERVLADVPREGFNLVLFGWVGGSVLLVALVGGAVLWRLRRTAQPPPPAGLSEADDRWLDEQLAREGSR